LMAACGVGIVVLVGSLRRAALPFLAVSPLLIGSLAYLRFDLFPALLVAGAVVCLVRDRDRLGWALLGVAVAAKLWPLALVPLALTWSWRRGRDNAELYGIATAAVWFVPFAVIAPHGLFASIHDQGNRPLQIESLGGALVRTFSSPTLDFSHGSQNVAGSGWLATLLVLVPLALAWSWRRGRDRAELFGIASAAVWFVPFAIIAPHGLWVSLREQADRPLQIESLGGALVRTFSSPKIDFSHGSQNVAGYGWLASLLVLATGVSLLALWLAFVRGPIDDARFVRYCAAVTCAVIAFGKVLSPQYLVWLIPLVPLVRGRRGYAATAVLAAGLLLTQGYFPWHYWPYVYDGKRAWVVLARDVSLVVLLAVLSYPARRRAEPRTP
jgi:uncharacterized membrane protein